MTQTRRIRNFSIVAHIDHGKSTLADRLIQKTGMISDRDFRDQILDSLDVERERGITVKSNTVTLPYKAKDGLLYHLNLIDTPGHVDFSYEVSRALSACEGILLLVDAAQGVEAQTLAHLYTAMEHNLEIIVVINKIDLPAADIEATREQIKADLGLNPDEAVLCSAKTGQGVDELLEAIVTRLPAPPADCEAPLRALVFDAFYDPFRGTIVSVRIKEGELKERATIQFMQTGAIHPLEELGYHQIVRKPAKVLAAGDVGYVIANIKRVRDIKVGDTITLQERPAQEPVPGFRENKPVVFSSLYPIQSDDYPGLVDALEKYTLTDGSLVYQKDSSAALGQGFRCGYLGLLHLEIVQERLEDEFDQAIIMTMPSVQYKFQMKDGSEVVVDNPQYYPDPMHIESSEEPYIRAHIMMPERYLGPVMELCRRRRGENSTFRYPSPGRIELEFDLPLAEVIFDFYDKLKSITQGYGSFDYEIIGYRQSDLVKLDILVNGEQVDALAMMVHKERARDRAVRVCDKLKEEIPRQMFKIAIQGAVGRTVIARSTINAFRKDVTAKCYGGDITRKRKLLEKQKKGKKRMKMVGQVEIPQSAFVSVLRTNDD